MGASIKGKGGEVGVGRELPWQRRVKLSRSQSQALAIDFQSRGWWSFAIPGDPNVAERFRAVVRLH